MESEEQVARLEQFWKMAFEQVAKERCSNLLREMELDDLIMNLREEYLRN